MSIFRKKKTNVVHTRNIRISDAANQDKIASFAVDYLLKNGLITDLNNISCTFGYLYEYAGPSFQGLLKLTKDTKPFYIAVQGMGLQLLDIDEEKFEFFTETFLDANSGK